MSKQALVFTFLLLLAEESIEFRFEVELIKKLNLKDTSPNWLVSPSTVAQTLSFLYLGRDGRKDYPLANTLRIAGRSHDKIMSFHQETGKRSDAEKFKVVNRVYFSSDFNMSNHMKNMSAAMRVSVENMNFQRPDKATDEIRKWFLNSFGKRSHLFTKDHLHNVTEMVAVQGLLVSCIWKHRFLYQFKGHFLIDRNEMKPIQQKITLMYTLANFQSFNDEEVHGLFIPFSGKDIGMLVLIPRHPFSTTKVISQLEKYLQLKMRKALETHLFLPVFDIHETMELNGILESMGVRKAFEIFEEGTSDKEVKDKNLEPETYANQGDQKTFKVNRPFVFVIKDQRTIYVAGRIDSIEDLQKRH
ncbi:hypothetical protein KR018_003607 [Drosophila ironensis]|nr:hypothetical protein KR018_003607 [Drosophila ironensis]